MDGDDSREPEGMCAGSETHLGKRPILVALGDKHGLLRSPGLFQRLVPLNATLGLTCICNVLTGQSVLRHGCCFTY